MGLVGHLLNQRGLHEFAISLQNHSPIFVIDVWRWRNFKRDREGEVMIDCRWRILSLKKLCFPPSCPFLMIFKTWINHSLLQVYPCPTSILLVAFCVKMERSLEMLFHIHWNGRGLCIRFACNPALFGSMTFLQWCGRNFWNFMLPSVFQWEHSKQCWEIQGRQDLNTDFP